MVAAKPIINAILKNWGLFTDLVKRRTPRMMIIAADLANLSRIPMKSSFLSLNAKWSRTKTAAVLKRQRVIARMNSLDEKATLLMFA